MVAALLILLLTQFDDDMPKAKKDYLACRAAVRAGVAPEGTPCISP